jgi:hypothetical protein
MAAQEAFHPGIHADAPKDTLASVMLGEITPCSWSAAPAANPPVSRAPSSRAGPRLALAPPRPRRQPRRQRPPGGDGPHAKPGLLVVRDQREVPPELDYGAQLAASIKSVADCFGGWLIDGEHRPSMEACPARKQAAR